MRLRRLLPHGPPRFTPDHGLPPAGRGPSRSSNWRRDSLPSWLRTEAFRWALSVERDYAGFAKTQVLDNLVEAQGLLRALASANTLVGIG